MGLVAKILSFTRIVRNAANISDVKVDPGGGANITPEHFSAPGDDSFPLTTDYVHIEPQTGTGRDSALGYLDPINDPVSLEGDKRIYARDPTTGLVVVELWLKSNGDAILSNDIGSITLFSGGQIELLNAACNLNVKSTGEIEGTNTNGTFSLEVGGTFTSNGAKFLTDGDIKTSDDISLRNHTHAQGNDSDGDTEQETEAPT